MTGLRITKADVARAVAQGLLREEQAAPLWKAWSERRADAPDAAPRFSITHVLYYLGGMIAIGAMTLFMNLGWERFADSLLFPFALTLIGLAIVAAGIWWQRNEARLSAALRARLPAGWRELLQTRHESLGTD